MRDLAKQTFRLLLVFALLFGLTTAPAFADLDNTQEANRAKLLSYVLRQQLSQHHYSEKPLNDDLSRAAYDLFIKQLDFQKRFLIQSDIDQLQPFATRIDNEMQRGQIELPQLAEKLLEERIDQVKVITTDLLKQPVPLDGKEQLETDPEKLDWCKSLPELKERWRKILTYQVLNTMLVLEEEGDASGKGKENLASLEVKAREKVAKRFNHFFDRLEKDTLRDYYDRYFSAVTRAYDPHTTYLPPQQKEDFEIGMRGSLEGIGATLREEDGFIKVVKIIPGSASARQGELDAEDVILAVAQGKEEPVDVTDARLRDAVELIRGPKGTEVRLTVKKPDGSRKIIPIIRDVVEIEETFVKSMTLDDPTTGRKYGYIKIPSFYRDFTTSLLDRNARNVTTDVAAALKSLKPQGISGLIIDLRNNGGGALKDAVNVSGLFIDQGPIVQVKSSGGNIQVLKDSDAGVAYDGPVTILVNRFSASASEIFAAAMQDYHRAYIIGSDHTYGKGTVQTILDLDRSIPFRNMDQYKPLGALKITTQKFYRVSGGSTQYKGVESDMVMPDRMKYVKSGEKYIDYSLPWDTVPATSYHPWNSEKALQINRLRSRSTERVAGNEELQEIIKSSEEVKKRQEETEVSLNFKQLKEEQRQGLEDDAESLAMHGDLDADEASAKAKTKADQVRLWQESVRKDPITHEALDVLSDLYPAVTAGPAAGKQPPQSSTAN